MSNNTASGIAKFLDKITIGDCLELLPEIPDNSIDLVCGDLPYNLAKYGDNPKDADNFTAKEYEVWLGKLTKEIYRVLKPNGVSALQVPKNKFDVLCRAYSKANLSYSLPPLSGWAKSDFRKLGMIPVPATVLNIRQKASYESVLLCGTKGSTKGNIFFEPAKLLEVKGNTWDLTSVWHEDITGIRHIHPCTTCSDIFKREIEGFTKEGDIVLDPCIGTGTTLTEALKLKRRCIGFDIYNWAAIWEGQKKKAKEGIEKALGTVEDSPTQTTTIATTPATPTANPNPNFSTSQASQLSEVCRELLKLGEKGASWYGKQMMYEFIQALILERIQRQYPDATKRIVTHKLLFCQYSWLKSTFLRYFYYISGREQFKATYIGSPTKEAMRGSVFYWYDKEIEEKKVIFVPPYPVQFHKLFVDEWSSISGKKQDETYIAYILTQIESGLGVVELVKNAVIEDEDRKALEKDYAEYNLKFTAKQTFQYKSNPLWFAATNQREAVANEALSSRFDTVMPERQFEAALLKHIKNNELPIDEGVFQQFRSILERGLSFNHIAKIEKLGDLIPDYLIDKYPPEQGNNPRIVRDTEAWVLANRIISFDINDNSIGDYMARRIDSQKKITAEGKELVLLILERQQGTTGLTTEQLIQLTNVSRASVSRYLETLINEKLVYRLSGKPPKYKLS